jgi:phage head maturation protease
MTRPAWYLEPTQTRELGARTESLRDVADALPPAHVRSAPNGGMPTLYGRFASFAEWAEIRSAKEGHFLERISPRAFEKTITENRENMRVLFHHGADPAIGMKVLGPIRSLATDTAYEVQLLDADYVRGLIPGLKEGLYGASFRFTVVKDEHAPRPRRSDWNPQGIPEVTITEARVIEFGPTPLPAYRGATAGVRSTRELVCGLHSSAYALGFQERWAMRAKPGCLGTYQRERVHENQRASWEARPEDAWWWLEEGDGVRRVSAWSERDWFLA